MCPCSGSMPAAADRSPSGYLAAVPTLLLLMLACGSEPDRSKARPAPDSGPTLHASPPLSCLDLGEGPVVEPSPGPALLARELVVSTGCPASLEVEITVAEDTRVLTSPEAIDHRLPLLELLPDTSIGLTIRATTQDGQQLETW